MGERNDDLKKTLEDALSEMDEKGDAEKATEEKRTEEMKAVQRRLEEKLEGQGTETAPKSETELEEPETELEEPEIEPEEPETESEEPETEPEESETEPEESEVEPESHEIAATSELPETESEEVGTEQTASKDTEPTESEAEAGTEPTESEAEAGTEPTESEAETVLESAADTENKKKKTKKKYNWVYNLVIVIGACMVLGGGFTVFRKYKSDADTKEMYSDVVEQYVTVNHEEETETEIDWGFDWVSADGSSSYTSTVWYEQISVDFDGLNSINEDVVGWIYQENGDISYPLMYSGDNEVYLKNTLYGAAASGSIFVGGENNPDMSDPLTMIYGHNMSNGSMFGSLKKYKNDDTFYQDHQYIQIYTEGGMAYRYQIYAYFEIDQTETAMEDLLFYDSEDETSAIVTEVVIQEEDDTQEEITTEVILNEENTYAAYLETIEARTLMDTDIEVTTEDQVIGLWTCNESGTKRLLIFAVKVDEHDFNEVEETQAEDLNALDR